MKLAVFSATLVISFAVETAQPDDDDWEPEKFGENFSKTFIGD